MKQHEDVFFPPRSFSPVMSSSAPCVRADWTIASYVRFSASDLLFSLWMRAPHSTVFPEPRGSGMQPFTNPVSKKGPHRVTVPYVM